MQVTANNDVVAYSPMTEERAARRNALKVVADKNPGSKGGVKAARMLADYDRLDEWLEMWGGNDGALFELCAQVSEGVTLLGYCEHYGLNRGLVCAWLGEDASRTASYHRAKRWVADNYVDDAVSIADRADVETVAVDKLRVDVRLKVAPMLDKSRFGKDEKAMTINVGANSLVSILGGLPSAGATARADEILQAGIDAIESGSVEGSTVIEGEAADVPPLASAAEDDPL